MSEIKELRRNIVLLSRALRNSEGENVGRKRHIESEIINCKSKRVRINAISGGNVQHDVELRSQRLKWVDINSAFQGRIRTGAIVNLKHVDPIVFLKDSLPLVRNRLRNALKKLDCLKVNFVFCGEFVKPSLTSENPEIDCLKYFNTCNYSVYKSSNLDEVYESAVDEIKAKLEEFQEKGSGFALKSIVNLTLNISKICLLKFNC